MKDRDVAAGLLDEASQRFLRSCVRATDGQWLFRPTATSWSMADVTEHVTISNRNIHRMLTRRLLDSPVSGRATDVLDLEIPYLFHRGEEPPDVAAPSGEGTDRQSAMESLRTSARSILDWADTVATDLRTVGVAHPAFGLLDGVQWLLFAAAHTERHRSQLIGLARHRNFPT
jgi:hypothetical protein